MKDVSRELLSVSYVLAVIDQDKMATRVLIENSLQFVSSSLDVLLPLRFEEVEALACNSLWVLLLEVFDCGDAFVEGRV